MKKELILSAISAITILNSCDDKVYYNIPQNETTVLNNNDSVYFVSNSNDIDTFKLNISHGYEVYDKIYYHEYVSIMYIRVNKKKSHISFSVRQQDAISISVDGFYYPIISKYESPFSLNIDRRNYDSVHMVAVNSFSDTIPCAIYYSTIYGILKYKFSEFIYFEIDPRF